VRRMVRLMKLLGMSTEALVRNSPTHTSVPHCVACPCDAVVTTVRQATVGQIAVFLAQLLVDDAGA
jgi:hypothetical protein